MNTRLTAALLGLALVAGIAGRAWAQASVWEGKFVAGPDGSTWAVKNGVRHRIQTAAITVEELVQLPEGEPVSTLGQLQDSGGSASAPAAEVSPLPSPPATLLGQTPRICNDGTPIRVQVVEADWTGSLGSVPGSSMAGSRWVTLVVSATNEGRDSENLYESTQLRDERGRTWEDVGGTASAVHIDYDQLAVQHGAQVVGDLLRPGVAARVLLVFGVSDDVQRLELISATGGC